MNRTGSTPPQNPPGSALVLSLIFIAVFAALAAALHTGPGSNLRIADHFRKADLTRGSAESGLEVLRYWLSGSSDLLFNRSGLDQVPAGFVPRIVMYYDPSSYTEAAI